MRQPEPALFLRIEEAAEILRISRTAAYELAHRWIASGGSSGMPAIRVGRMIRVPVPVFYQWASIDEPIARNPN